jgi:cytoskeletal protein RodZ
MKTNPLVRFTFLLVVFVVQFIVLILNINTFFTMQNQAERKEAILQEEKKEQENRLNQAQQNIRQEMESSKNNETLERIDDTTKPEEILAPESPDADREIQQNLIDR